MNKIVFFLGILLLLLPFGLKYIENNNQQDFIATYEKEVKSMESEKLKSTIEKAVLYNENLYLTDEFESETYEKQLNIVGNGVMGSIEIPKINLKLPIYHGTEEEILTNGVGHLKESSLPVPGENVHGILTGHRGLPDAQLFTRLDEMKKEDIFCIHICGESFWYKVCEIQVVKPEEVEILEIQPGRSLISLITCTPYGINTHRLVVMGEYYEEPQVEEVEVDRISNRDVLFLLIPVVLCAIGKARALNETRKC